MREPVGIGGVVAALSVTSDLTRGHPPGEAMRACLLATELRQVGVSTRAGLAMFAMQHGLVARTGWAVPAKID